VKRVLFDRGMRFVFSTRSKVPYLLREGTGEHLYGGDYEFQPGKDEVSDKKAFFLVFFLADFRHILFFVTIQWVRKGKAGAIVAFGDMVYRALDAVERLRADGLDVALINKSTLNQVDEEAIREYGTLPFVLVIETQNRKTGLGSKMGTWLLERQLTPRYRSVSQGSPFSLRSILAD
jgi:hypothetical protein